MGLLPNEIVKNLQTYYNKEAKKYHQTRQKFWLEKEFLIAVVKKYIITYKPKELCVLEFGCGDGRFFREVLAKFIDEIPIFYIGVDISDELLVLAEQELKIIKGKKKLTTHFVHDNIINYIEKLTPESFDLVVGIASFQHIVTVEERKKLLDGVYSVLRYDGLLLMLNRSFSLWFLKKYWKSIGKVILNILISLGRTKWNDVYLPWKIDEKEVVYRYYHIFLLKELEQLLFSSAFVIRQLSYITKEKQFTWNFKYARNSFVVAQKSIV